MTYEEAETLLRETLAALPETDDQIAAVLLGEGCRGTPGKSCDCPVARYLTKKTKHACRAGTTAARISPGAGLFCPVVDLPGPVATFIRCFDNGSYPELVES